MLCHESCYKKKNIKIEKNIKKVYENCLDSYKQQNNSK